MNNVNVENMEHVVVKLRVENNIHVMITSFAEFILISYNL